jgi:hypothetical protein
MPQKDKTMYLLNAFSLNMIVAPATVNVSEISVDEVIRRLNGWPFISAVGHADTAAVFGSALGLPISANRETVTLHTGADAIVGQYVGPRLPEGATTLPEGATIKWLFVAVE